MHENVLIIGTSSSSPLAEERHTLENLLHYKVAAVAQPYEAVEHIRSNSQPCPDIVLIDVAKHCDQGVVSGCMQSLKALKPDLPIILFLDYGDEERRFKTIENGAYDYLSKPVPMQRLHTCLRNALKMRRMSQYITWLERKVAGHMDIGDMVGESEGFQHVLGFAKEASASSLPVWIDGEPGTGKTLLARAIHGSSDRAGKPFVTVNCQMLPEHLAHGMLFGQEKTILPSKVHFILGKLREADQGTLLLQEAGALQPELQDQLIAMLKTGEIKPLGSQTATPINVRLMCTGIRRGKLPQYGKWLTATLPALRERTGDVARLAEHFLMIYATSENKYISSMTDRARQWLDNNAWPGNIAQLSNTVWRAVMLCEGPVLDIEHVRETHKTRSIYLADSPESVMSGQGHALIDAQGRVKSLKSIEEEAIKFALRQADGCMTRAARSLGIGRSTLYRKVGQLALDS